MTFALPACVSQGNALSLQQQGLPDVRQSQTIDCAALIDFDSSVLAVLMAHLGLIKRSGRVLISGGMSMP